MYDYMIIGAGIIGLNIAKVLKEKDPLCDVIVIEKEPKLGLKTHGRNSGVLHSGFYYAKNSLKAKFTQEGHIALKEFCLGHNLKLKESQRIVVASNEDELAALEELKLRSEHNGEELLWLNELELQSLFPNIKTYKKALYSPKLLSVNPNEVVEKFAKIISDMGITIKYNCKYKGVHEHIVSTSTGDFSVRKVINCAGLHADSIARDFGFSKNHVILPLKGIYTHEKKSVARLINNDYSFAHLPRHVLGLNYTFSAYDENDRSVVVPAYWKENYNGFENFSLWEFLQISYYEFRLFLSAFVRSRQKRLKKAQRRNVDYFKNLCKKFTLNMHLKSFEKWGKVGIRGQLLNKSTLQLEEDFVVESDKKSVHVLNSVSPAFTSSIPFAKWIVDEHILK